jgi:hypothetical protein
MKFDSKAHMAQELIAGKLFTSHLGVTIHYDPSEELTCPFRYGDKSIGGVWELYNRDIWEEVKPRHVHQDLIDSYQDGQVWQYRHNVNANWLNLSNHLTSWQPDWKEDTQYRLHPYNDLIQAHNSGAKIEYYVRGDWVVDTDPDWYEDIQYRIKPNTKTVYEWLYKTNFTSNWEISPVLKSEEEAKDFFDRCKYKKTGREFEVEV